MNSGSFKNVIYKMCLQIIYLIYMYRKDLALNDLLWLICHKTKPNQTKPNSRLLKKDPFKISQWLLSCDIIWLSRTVLDKLILRQMLQICLGWKVFGTEVNSCFPFPVSVSVSVSVSCLCFCFRFCFLSLFPFPFLFPVSVSVSVSVSCLCFCFRFCFLSLFLFPFLFPVSVSVSVSVSCLCLCFRFRFCFLSLFLFPFLFPVSVSVSVSVSCLCFCFRFCFLSLSLSLFPFPFPVSVSVSVSVPCLCLCFRFRFLSRFKMDCSILSTSNVLQSSLITLFKTDGFPVICPQYSISTVGALKTLRGILVV